MMEIEIHSDPGELAGVREQLRAWTTARGWAEQQIGEIILAVDEALTNVIRHGYCGASHGRIAVSVNATDDPADGPGLEIRVRDFCPNVDLEKIAGRDLDDVRPGGLGVHLIRAMMQEVEYSHAEGGGVLLVMRKRQSHAAGQQPDDDPTQGACG